MTDAPTPSEQDLVTCSRCKQAKPPEAFYNSTHSSTGRQAYCKECGMAYRQSQPKTARTTNSTGRRRKPIQRRATPRPDVAKDTLLHCANCKRELPTSEFHLNRHTARGYNTYCRKCVTALRKNQHRSIGSLADMQRQLDAAQAQLQKAEDELRRAYTRVEILEEMLHRAYMSSYSTPSATG